MTTMRPRRGGSASFPRCRRKPTASSGTSPSRRSGRFSACWSTGGLTGGVEAVLYTGVGWVIDALSTSTPATLVADHGWLLFWLAFITLIGRSLILFVASVLEEQVISPSFYNRVRWQSLPAPDGAALHVLPERFRRPHRPEGAAGRRGDRRLHRSPRCRPSGPSSPSSSSPSPILGALDPGWRWCWCSGRSAMSGSCARCCRRSVATAARPRMRRSWSSAGVVDSFTNILLRQTLRQRPQRGCLRQGRLPPVPRLGAPADARADLGPHRRRRAERRDDDRHRNARRPRLAGRQRSAQAASPPRSGWCCGSCRCRAG